MKDIEKYTGRFLTLGDMVHTNPMVLHGIGKNTLDALLHLEIWCTQIRWCCMGLALECALSVVLSIMDYIYAFHEWHSGPRGCQRSVKE